MDVGARTDPGLTRPHNEDSLFTPEGIDAARLAARGLLFIVADGIGGLQEGKAASQLAIREVTQAYYADADPDVGRSLARAIQTANARIHSLAAEPGRQRMGTTIVAAVVQNRTLTVASVGDSRAYLVRGQTMRQLTQDHTWVADQVRAGLLTAEQARRHSQRNVVLRSLGNQPEVQVDLRQEALRAGDTLLLCSDGLTGELPDAEIHAVAASQPAQVAADRLVDLANERGGSDNITAVVVRVPRQAAAGGPGRGTVGEDLRQALAQPRSGRSLIWWLVGGAALIVTVVLALALLLSTRPPQAPAIVEAPVVYTVQPGDAAHLTRWFGGNPENSLGPLVPGDRVEFQPETPTYFVTGLVTRPFDAESDQAFKMANSSETYTVTCTLAGGSASGDSQEPPQKGDLVTVVGIPVADKKGHLQALIVNVGRPSLFWMRWSTWYNRYDRRGRWAYTGFGDNLLRAEEEFEAYAGEPALIWAVWSLEGSGVLVPEPALVLTLQENAYRNPGVPSRLTPSPLDTPTASSSLDSSDQTAAAPSPAVPPATKQAASLWYQGVVTATALNVRDGPGVQYSEIDLLDNGDRVEIECQISEWYKIRASEPSYVKGEFVEVQGASQGDIPPCPAP
jgi:serine/threonine protein phosphatase PrpC